MSKSSAFGTTFTWTVKNFAMCPNTFGDPLKSPEFGLYSWPIPKFHLLLYPRGIDEKSTDFLSLYIVKSDNDNENKITYICKLGIVANEEKMLCKKFHHQFLQDGGQGARRLINREELLNKGHLQVPGCDLTVFCEISENNMTNPGYFKIHEDEDISELSKDLEQLYEDKKFGDINIRTRFATRKIHRAILNIRFPELLEKLKDKDSNTNETEVMYSLMSRYLYSGIFEKKLLNEFELTKIAEKIPRRLIPLIASRIQNVQVVTRYSSQMKVVSCTWEIQNYSTLGKCDRLQYSLIGNVNYTWTWFKFSLHVMKFLKQTVFTFFIKRYSPECRRITCKIQILDKQKTFDHIFQEDDKGLACTFVDETLIASSTVLNDTLNFEIEITVTSGSLESEMEKTELFPFQDKHVDDVKSFQRDFRKLLNDTTYSDVTVVCGEDEFPAHKCILSARSPIFSEMLQNKSSKDKIVIADLESKVVRYMLLYIYSGDIGFSFFSTKQIIGLYSAAKKYDIPGLKKKCLSLLRSFLDADNSGEILITAEKWNDEELKECVYEYICLHPQDIADSKQWREFIMVRSDIALEVLNRTLTCLASKK